MLGVLLIIILSAGVSALAQELVLCIDTPCIGVMSAFSSELTILLDETQDKLEYQILGRTVTTGYLQGHPVVLGLSGVSMTNAAMTTQAWFDKFNISHLVFSGIAGGVNPNLNIGDVAIPEQWAEYQEFRFCREEDGEFNCNSDLPNFGMMFPSSGPCVTTISGTLDQCERVRWFEVDKAMLKIATKVSRKVELARCGLDRNGNEVCLDVQPIIKVGGNGVAGPTFVDNADFREYTWDVFEADSLDMESSAVAHVAYTNEIPFLAFRSLSDLAGGGEGQNQIGTFFRVAADNSASVLLAFLEEWKAK